MSEVAVVAPGEGEVIGDSPERRVEILSDDDTLHATWSRFGPGREGADLHVHRRHTDLFYVLEGELEIRLGLDDEPVAVSAGTLARVPPLVVHSFRNASDAEVIYLNFHAPGEGFAGYMRALRDGHEPSYDQHQPPADGGRPKTEAAFGGAELPSAGPDRRFEQLADVDEIAIWEIRADPGAKFSPPSEHRSLESLYVLAGEVGVDVGNQELRARAGSWVQVFPGASRKLLCPGPHPVRLLRLQTPNRAEARDR